MDDDEMVRLDAWVVRLADELGVTDLVVDRDAILGLAGRAAHGVLRPAAPLTTFLVGYAAARAVERGTPSEAAVREAVERAVALIEAE